MESAAFRVEMFCERISVYTLFLGTEPRPVYRISRRLRFVAVSLLENL